MMTIQQIYDLAIELAIKNDLRGPARARRVLARAKEEYDSLPKDQKQYFDVERLRNPYSDSRFFAENPNMPIRTIIVGIDLDTEEVLLAHELNKKGRKIDLIMSHHPVGSALASLHEVMHLQAEVMATYGVPINIAESLMHVRMSEVSRSLDPYNHNRVVDAAQLLDFPLVCLHTATDNLVATYLKNLLKQHSSKIETVGDVMTILKTVPEYQVAMRQRSGPVLYAGTENRFAGKIAVTEVTGGTEGSRDMYERLAQAGVGTIVGMHMKEEHKREAEKHHINVIIAGHMSSDSIGMNLFLDRLAKRGITIIPCSGLLRVSRNAKKTAKKR
ncbi:MAG: NGG1p interacting factor NIF3 [Parcubacteria group bacterium]